MSYDLEFKLVLIGDKGVGKKTLRERYDFKIPKGEPGYSSKVDVYAKDIELNNVGICRMYIWELEIDRRARSQLPNFLEEAKGLMFMFDLTKASTLTLFDEWVKILRETNPDIPILLVGNKVDISERRKTDQSEAFEYVHDRFCKAYTEISAKSGKKVEIAFHMMAQIMWDSQQKSPTP